MFLAQLSFYIKAVHISVRPMKHLCLSNMFWQSHLLLTRFDSYLYVATLCKLSSGCSVITVSCIKL